MTIASASYSKFNDLVVLLKMRMLVGQTNGLTDAEAGRAKHRSATTFQAVAAMILRYG